MCIIVYKPAGVEMPSANTLSNCFLNNPDGAGYMFLERGSNMVRVRKGFMAYSSLMDSLETVKNITDIPVVLHFRITTQGNTDQKNTHPFPVTSEHDSLVSRSSIAPVAVAHNGIIQLTTSYTGYKTNNKEQYSDTYYFVRDYFSLIVDNNPYWYQNKNNVKLARKLADSKLAVLSGDGHCVLIGAFTQNEEDGCYYSNDTYKYATGWRNHGGYGRYGSWDDADDFEDPYVYTFINGETKPKLARWYGFSNDGEVAAFVSSHENPDVEIDDDREEQDEIEVLGAYIPTSGVVIINENTGNIIDPNSDLFVHDLASRVYWYDDKSNKVTLLLDYTSVDEDTFEPVGADPKISCKFKSVV